MLARFATPPICSPFCLRPGVHHPTDTGALADGFDPFKAATGLEDLSLAAAGGGAAAAAKPQAAAAGGGGGSKRPPLSSVMTLVPEHFPEELYSSKDMRSAMQLQSHKHNRNATPHHPPSASPRAIALPA